MTMVIQTLSVYDTYRLVYRVTNLVPTRLVSPPPFPSPRVNTLEDDPSIGVDTVFVPSPLHRSPDILRDLYPKLNTLFRNWSSQKKRRSHRSKASPWLNSYNQRSKIRSIFRSLVRTMIKYDDVFLNEKEKKKLGWTRSLSCYARGQNWVNKFLRG